MLFGGEGVFVKDIGKFIFFINYCLSLFLFIFFRGGKRVLWEEK